MSALAKKIEKLSVPSNLVGRSVTVPDLERKVDQVIREYSVAVEKLTAAVRELQAREEAR